MRLRYSVPMSGKKRCASSLPSASRPKAEASPRGTSATERTCSAASPNHGTQGLPAARPHCGPPSVAACVIWPSLTGVPASKPTGTGLPQMRSATCGTAKSSRRWKLSECASAAKSRAPTSAAARRCTFSLMASFSSPKRISSPSLPSSAFTFSRSASVWRSESGIARPPCGCGTWIFSRSSGCWSKNFGLLRRKMAKSSAFMSSYVEGAFEGCFGRALHPYGIVAAGPRDGQRAAARIDAHRRVGELLRDRRHRRGAGAGSAGQRLPRAALPYSQGDVVARQDLHIPGVDALGKARVALDARTLGRHRREFDLGDALHRVRIAHREHGELYRFGSQAQRLEQRFGKLRRAHVDAHFAVGLETRTDHAAGRLDADLALAGEAPGAHELDEAARAVAALLDFAAVGVEDAIAEVDALLRRPLDDQQLVEADAEVPVGERADLLAAEREVLLRRVDDDEIVARALHLGERQLHRRRFNRTGLRLPGAS